MSPLFRRRAAQTAQTAESPSAPAETPEHPTPTYQGRPLDRPEEDLEDQGLAFDLGTLIDRRRALGILGLGAGSLALAACGASSGGTGSSASSSPSAAASSSPAQDYDTEMPQETAGPYPGDGSNGQDVLEVSGVERSNITTSIGEGTAVDGVAMTLTMSIVDMVQNNGP